MAKLHRCAISVALCRFVFAQAAPPPSSELLQNADGANDTFSAVGQFRGPLTCTGTLIDPSGTGAADARAWLLTAGHCVSLDPYGVIRGQPLRALVTFNFFIDTPGRRVAVSTRATGWSTMKGADLALIELEATLGDLRARGIRPLRLAAASSAAGSPVFWTGISLNPIPGDQQFLRRGRCTQGNRAQLVESMWIWHNDMSNDCPDLYGGASGSPLFDAGSGDIIGVIGTGTLLNFDEGPDYDCQINRPCVMRAGGPVMEKDTGYASPVPNVAPCFDQANALDLQRPGCPLDPGYQLGVNSGANEVKPVTDGKPAAWDAALTGTQRHYAYKLFAAGEGDCTNSSGYGAPIAVASAPIIRDAVGSADGYYFLCIIAGDTPSVDSSWQKPAHASTRFKRIDSQPPMAALDYMVEDAPGGYHLLNTSGVEGPSGLGASFYKLGPLASTDCSDPQDYRVQLSIPPIIRPSEFPTRMCWKLSDKAGNLTVPVAFDFGPPTVFPNAMQNGASLERGAVTPGGMFRVDTFNLTTTTEYSSSPVPSLAGVSATLLDAAGRTLPVNLTTAGPLFIEALLPDAAAPGDATLTVQPPQGPALSQAVTIRRVAPGIYYDSRTDAPVGFVSDNMGTATPLSTCTQAGPCRIARLQLASTPGGLEMILYGTGFRNATGQVRIHIGTHVIDNVTVSRHPDIAGVDELHFHVPQDFPLHLYQTISVETANAVSNHPWIYLE
jgi:uncharacterized protein (TIGR03437 family)